MDSERIEAETKNVFSYDWSKQENPFDFACDINNFEDIIESIKTSNTGNIKIGAIYINEN